MPMMPNLRSCLATPGSDATGKRLRSTLGESLYPAVLLVAVMLTASAGTAVAADNEACENGSGDAAIAACSRAIASKKYSGRNLERLYNFRGVAYRRKGDPDKAIADF